MKISNVALASYLCLTMAIACPDHEEAKSNDPAPAVVTAPKTNTLKAGNLTISSCWVRPGQEKMNTAAYLTIKNATPEQEDQLLKAECTVANSVELHDHINENGVMQMRPVPTINIKDSAELKPGSLHVMLMNLKQDLKVGDKIQVKLTFAKAGEISIEFPVDQPKIQAKL